MVIKKVIFRNIKQTGIKSIIILFGLVLAETAFSQNKEKLKEQKEKLENEIQYTKKILTKTEEDKTKSLEYLSFLDAQIKNKEKYSKILTTEIKLLNREIKNSNKQVLETEKEIEESNLEFFKLKKEYEKLIYFANKNKINQNRLIFIVSSRDFNQAYKRLLYLKQYSFSRKNQAKKIIETKKKLEKTKEKLREKKEDLERSKAEKKVVLLKKEQELTEVEAQKNEKKQIIKKLTQSQKKFRQKIQQQEKKAKELEQKIKKIIEEEIRKNRKKTKEFKLTPESKKLSASFQGNKGRLPWPLEQAVIVQGYGKQKHELFGGIETFNNGIDLATDENSNIRTVFDGTVARIFFIKGIGKAVLIKHGKYFTVYSGIKEVFVKTGDRVKSKEKIGVILTSENNKKTQLHFEIWENYEKQNPMDWLYKAY